jgi:Trk K+ transport system NAD-binding subunit
MRLNLGAGRVGESVAESLVTEQNDITVIDSRHAGVAVTGSAGPNSR